MIITRLSGGLGNQLFQYALGRALALENRTELVLDATSYGNQLAGEAPRRYSLSRFAIQARLAAADDFSEVGVPPAKDRSFIARLRRKLLRLRERSKPLQERRLIIEQSFAFDERILGVRSPAYLAGVWQSEKYFAKHGDTIRAELRLKEPLSEAAARLNAEIEAAAAGGGTSVALHIRRGDQVSDPRLVSKHGLLGNDYYADAISYLKTRAAAPARYFIFSDDIAWVRENLNLGEACTYVSALGLADYEELILMSRCRHIVIAKSSFSWWAAWLNPHPDKIIIAPKQRFGHATNEDRDLIPASWTQI